MSSQLITEKAILNALLAPRQMTARDLLQSNLVGLWADRADIGDSVVFARQLRERAEQRGSSDVAR
ncbi:MAG: hypothetical protein HY740_08555 [Chloroflexi bacterium]|nr:hypothetical protein [Chloroflexota bacterium]